MWLMTLESLLCLKICSFLSEAWVYKKDGLKPNPNDSRWVALSVGPDVVNDSRFGALSLPLYFWETHATFKNYIS